MAAQFNTMQHHAKSPHGCRSGKKSGTSAGPLRNLLQSRWRMRSVLTHCDLIIFSVFFLVMVILIEFLHLLASTDSDTISNPLLSIGLTPTVLILLLGGGAFCLIKSLARAGSRRQTLGHLPADRSPEADEWRRTFDILPDFVSVHDQDFKIVKANQALCELLDKKPEELIGRHCYRLFHDRDSPIEGCPHAKAQDIGHPVTMEIHDSHLGVPLLITCSPLTDGQGNFAGSVHFARIQPSPRTGREAPAAPFIPICASCKDIRDDHGNWMKIEDYVHLRLNGRLTHSICQKCRKRIYPRFFQD